MLCLQQPAAYSLYKGEADSATLHRVVFTQWQIEIWAQKDVHVSCRLSLWQMIII